MEKNKGKNTILILLFLLLIFNVAVLITFFVYPHSKKSKNDKCDRKQDRIECLMTDLKLTPEQETAFNSSREEHKKHMTVIFDSVKTLRNNMLDALLQEPSPSEADLMIYAEKIGQMEMQVQVESIHHFLKMKTLLNADQFSVLINNFKEMCGCHQKPSGMNSHKNKMHSNSEHCKNHNK